MEPILLECQGIVDEVCEKYGYDDIDYDDKDSLKTVLLKIIPAMLKDEELEARKLFYQMLEHTPIVVLENITEDIYNELVEKYAENPDLNLIIEENNIDEYTKNFGAGAYVSRPIIDKNMKLQGKKSFIYIQKVKDSQKKFLGTDINVPHLIHELGHAWNAEKDEYVMGEDKILKDRVGTAEFIYSVSKQNDKTIKLTCETVNGLMLEEGMNTIAEEQAMANYMGISLEEMKEKYNNILVPSNYQGLIKSLVEHMLQKLNAESFKSWRLYGNTESKKQIEACMDKTEYWKNRENIVSDNSDSSINYQNKKAIINQIGNIRAQEFFEKYSNEYFPDILQMTPLEKIENVLMQMFNINAIKYIIGVEHYKEIATFIAKEGYFLVNQTADIMKEDELNKVISDIRISEVTEIYKETRDKGTKVEQRSLNDE